MKPSKRKIKPLTVAVEVLDAINQGKRTFSEIRQETGRTAERVSEAIAFLMFKAQRIRTQKTSNGHVYLPLARPARKPEQPQRAPRNETPSLSFSTLSGLMPLRATVRVSEVRK